MITLLQIVFARLDRMKCSPSHCVRSMHAGTDIIIITLTSQFVWNLDAVKMVSGGEYC